MDPTATLTIINDATATNYDRTEALDNLATWLAKGGFAPDDAGILDDAREHFRELGLTATVDAINVAIAYGDLSGLDGLGFEVAR